ncbi:hypothetical protein H4W00_001814 [Psychrobacter sp. PL19]|uniref:hypothetical protein n=1 Tax=Psychrobacter sp. PL19 TaxID=2760711 RepID=UPI001AE500F8
MKDYKVLLIGLILLMLIISNSVFTWLWQSNRKNVDPLPIVANEATNSQLSANASEDLDTAISNVLYVQAEDKLQVPLDDVIISFESRYPNVQVLARYVSNSMLLTLPDSRISGNEPSKSMVNVDLIIADDGLTQAQLSSLQTLINEAQTKLKQSKVNADADADADSMAQDDTANNEARNLTSFSYGIKESQAVDGVVLTDNPIAISFRNFLLSSAGQDVLKKYDYGNIDGYRNNMDDLFNTKSQAKSAVDKSSVTVTDALSNGK